MIYRKIRQISTTVATEWVILLPQQQNNRQTTKLEKKEEKDMTPIYIVINDLFGLYNVNESAFCF